MSAGAGPLSLKYRTTRGHIWRAYWFTWRRNHRLKLVHAGLFGVVAWNIFSAVPQNLGALRLAVAALAGGLAVGLLTVYPLLRFKSEERTLTLAANGIDTSIGTLAGQVTWPQVSHIASAPDCTYIVRANGNSFAIPNTTFESDHDRAEFVRQAVEWWTAAQQPA